MRKIIAIYNNFFTSDGMKESIGGIQTYLRNLLPYFVEIGYEVELHQIADFNFSKDYRGVKVIGHIISSSKSKYQDRELYALATSGADHSNDILIFATSTNIANNDFSHSLAIQHGITWDVPKHFKYSHRRNLFQIFLKAILAHRTIADMDKVKNLVCVDNNYVNWYRTQVAYPDVKTYTISNFTEVPDALPERDHDGVRIIFARRLQQYRGTRLFAEVIERIIEKYPQVSVTIAGTGPDEKYMKDRLSKFPQIDFITYNSEDSIKIHRDKDIAVVPTLGSEGTSLSLLEAMASGCAPIATNVGGMSNILLDGYNGLLINPEYSELFDALEMLICDKELRVKIADNAYKTVKQSFGINKWKEKWRKVINNV